MAYTKTNWNENTPITADKLNKIETGVANSLDTTTGGLVNGNLTVKGHIQSDGGNFYSYKNGGSKPVIEVFDGDSSGSAVAYSAGGLTVLGGGESASLVVQNISNTQEDAVVSADQGIMLYAGLQNGWSKRKTVEFSTSGRLKLHNNLIEFTPNNSGYARMGFDGETNDVYISNINNHLFRLKGDKTITYAGHKVYTAFDKPTAADVGALPTSGGTLTGTLTMSKASGNTYYYAQRTDTGTTVRMGVGEGGINHGLYSDTLGKWMVYANATKVYLNGTASEWNGYTMRTGSGLSGTSGTITFTW